MLRTVLLPTDFSSECTLVWDFASGLGALGVHRVVLAHVVDASGMEGPVIGAKADEARDQLAAVAERLEAAGLTVELRVRAGDPYHELLALSHESAIDAIVCGTHGKRLIAQMVQGSISERLLQEGDTPILLARYDLMRESGDPAALARRFGERLVMPTDFSGPARRAFDMAVRLPAGVVEELHILHVIEEVLDPERREKIANGAEFQLENLHEIAERLGVTSSFGVRVGDPKKESLAEVADRGASGVVVGSKGRSPLGEALMGSVSNTLVREAGCPVLVVH